MSAIEKIEAVLGTGLLLPQLMIVPKRGASDNEIRREEALLGRSLCSDHAAILRRWNGIAMDVMRLFGCGDNASEIGRLSALQIQGDFGVKGAIVIGSDASGFAYLQAADERVLSLDTDSGEFKQLAVGLDEFFERLVFGPEAASFAGEDWLAELREVGLVS